MACGYGSKREKKWENHKTKTTCCIPPLMNICIIGSDFEIIVYSTLYSKFDKVKTLLASTVSKTPRGKFFLLILACPRAFICTHGCIAACRKIDARPALLET